MTSMSANRSRVMHMAHILDQNTFVKTGRRWPWTQILKYAWYFERFRGWLQSTTVTFSYRKKDGSIREAHGTLCPDLIPPEKKPVTSGQAGISGLSAKKKSYAFFPYYDLSRQAWRSFDIRLFIGFVTIHEDSASDKKKKVDKKKK